MTDAPPAADELAGRLAAFRAAAEEAGNDQLLADLDRLPILVDEIDRQKATMDRLWAEQVALVLRLDRVLSQSLIGHAAGRSKSFAGRIIGKAKRKAAAAA